MYRKLDRNAKRYLSFLFVLLIKIIKNLFSIPNGTCKHIPTCTEYSRQVIEKNNVIIAFVKILIRILKCNPLSKGGYDPA